jgi:hypothetical protein
MCEEKIICSGQGPGVHEADIIHKKAEWTRKMKAVRRDIEHIDRMLSSPRSPTHERYQRHFYSTSSRMLQLEREALIDPDEDENMKNARARHKLKLIMRSLSEAPRRHSSCHPVLCAPELEGSLRGAVAAYTRNRSDSSPVITPSNEAEFEISSVPFPLPNGRTIPQPVALPRAVPAPSHRDAFLSDLIQRKKKTSDERVIRTGQRVEVEYYNLVFEGRVVDVLSDVGRVLVEFPDGTRIELGLNEVL